MTESIDRLYKKMAGTSAVFIEADLSTPSPVERDGMSWDRDELKFDSLPDNLNYKDSMANALALEGLEDYDPPINGDVRLVSSINKQFVYLSEIRGWVQI